MLYYCVVLLLLSTGAAVLSPPRLLFLSAPRHLSLGKRAEFELMTPANKEIKENPNGVFITAPLLQTVIKRPSPFFYFPNDEKCNRPGGRHCFFNNLGDFYCLAFLLWGEAVILLLSSVFRQPVNENAAPNTLVFFCFF